MKILRLLVIPVFVLLATLAFAADTSKYLFFVGTYTNDEGKATSSKGIYAYYYDPAAGKMDSLGVAAETTNPSWLAISPNGKFLYAVNEVPNYKGPNSGGLSAFAIDRDKNDRPNGKLTFLNEVATRGADPCYVTIDKTGKWALVANYTGGSVAVFPIGDDGKLGEASDFIQHKGHGANPKRQEGPHAHSIDLSHDNRFAYVDDLGLDEVLVYKFDEKNGKLTPNDPPFAKVDAGAGPRHIAFSPDESHAFVLTEIQGTVNAFSNSPAKGEMHFLQKITTLPKDYSGEIEDAEIRMHPSGKFVYASSRGDANSISVYAVDEKASAEPLKLVEMVSTAGKTPRSFEIDTTGTLLVAENEKSDTLLFFGIDEATGKLHSTGTVLHVPSPVCVKFLVLKWK
ncbi:MAG TPA: lactonase family protein [Candidatus Solibacter sp.]|nr:lactonase family protein [Candidatus Solibacter sp.]